MEFLLGPDGDLRTLPIIEHTEQVRASRAYPAAIQSTLYGRSVMDIMGRSRGRWRLDWRYLTLDQRDLIFALASGALGSPLRLIDPSQPNLLMPNVALGGSETRDAEDFRTSYGALSWADTDTPAAIRATGAIRWVRSGTTAGDLDPGVRDADWRVPIRSGVNMRVSVWARQTSGTASVSLGVDHWDAAGARTLHTEAATALGTAWTELVIPAWTPPTGAIQMSPALRVAAGQVASTIETTGWSVITDGSTAWRTGGGAPLVIVTNFDEDRPSLNEHDLTIALAEV